MTWSCKTIWHHYWYTFPEALGNQVTSIKPHWLQLHFIFVNNIKKRCEYRPYWFVPSNNAMFNLNLCGNKKCIFPLTTLYRPLSQNYCHSHATTPHIPLPSDIPFFLRIWKINNHQPSKYNLFFMYTFIHPLH